MRSTISALVLVLLAGCSQRKLPSGGIIRGAGEFAPVDQSWSLSIAPDGRYRVHMTPQITAGFDWKPQNGWFVFIEDAKHLWTFDGASELYVFVWTPDGSFGRYDMAAYRQDPPAVVMEALPEAVRETIHQKPKRGV